VEATPPTRLEAFARAIAASPTNKGQWEDTSFLFLVARLLLDCLNVAIRLLLFDPCLLLVAVLGARSAVLVCLLIVLPL
jgi:hypothetical protein